MEPLAARATRASLDGSEHRGIYNSDWSPNKVGKIQSALLGKFQSALTAHGNEFIQDTPSLSPVARGVSHRQCTDQLVSCCHTDPPHLRSPSTLLRSKLHEATGQPPGAFPARQCDTPQKCRLNFPQVS